MALTGRNLVLIVLLIVGVSFLLFSNVQRTSIPKTTSTLEDGEQFHILPVPDASSDDTLPLPPIPPSQIDVDASTQPGEYFEDGKPIRNALNFLVLAESQISQRAASLGVSTDSLTCNGQMSLPFIDALVSSQMNYCVLGYRPSSTSKVYCNPIQSNPFTSWWPVKAAFCQSNGLKPSAGAPIGRWDATCLLSSKGEKLKAEMESAGEKFIGTNMVTPGGREEKRECKTTVDHTLLIVPRQDQWNPFHAAEDFSTTFISLLIAGRVNPKLVDKPLQVVFDDQFELERNHFSEVWDRIGSWSPRRLALDPFASDTCLTDAIHSIGAGVSIFSAKGVSKDYGCISSVAWASSHYYRSLFGFKPRMSSSRRNEINVLFLSRALFDMHASSAGEMDGWRNSRHLLNEEDLVSGLKNNLERLCNDDTDAEDACVFEDVDKDPQLWGSSSSGPIKVHFMSIDPSVHTLPSQVHAVGNSDIVISTHGGQLGLIFFLPPGQGKVIELQTPGGSAASKHFGNMARMMGHRYEGLAIQRTVDVTSVWKQLERQVIELLKTR